MKLSVVQSVNQPKVLTTFLAGGTMIFPLGTGQNMSFDHVFSFILIEEWILVTLYNKISLTTLVNKLILILKSCLYFLQHFTDPMHIHYVNSKLISFIFLTQSVSSHRKYCIPMHCFSRVFYVNMHQMDVFACNHKFFSLSRLIALK